MMRTPSLEQLISQRVLGTYDGPNAGPTYVVMGGIHGNEPAGALAARAVLDELARSSLPLRGRFIGLVGNRAALSQGRRYVETDLNRGWRPEDIERLMAADPATDGPEDAERRDLISMFNELESQSDEPLAFFDLHTTSAPSAPFACASDTLRNRRVIFSLGVPVILGLEESLDGSVMGFLSDRGHVACAVEGGQHDAPLTRVLLEVAIWRWLVASGAIDAKDIPDFEARSIKLQATAIALPPVVEVRYRHGIKPGDEFVMNEGWESFDRVEEGERLARDKRGEIRSPFTGLMLMPLYQSQGDDGFFIISHVPRWRIVLSRWMRKMRVERWLAFLPGIHRHDERDDVLVVDAKRAGPRLELLLFAFGYRRREPGDGVVVFSRRRPWFLGRAEPMSSNEGL